jgi:hypothetical protein
VIGKRAAYLVVLGLGATTLWSPLAAAPRGRSLPTLRPAGSGGVRIGLAGTGRRVIFNESVAQHARRFATELVAVPDRQLEPLIEVHARAQSLDPKLVKAVIQVESGYNAAALSNKGAIGLMQLMPDTARLLDVLDPYDPVQNLRGGVAYLRQLLDRFSGQVEYAVAAYNAGPGAVEKHGGIPPYPETQDYVRRVLSLYRGDATLRVPAEMAAYPGRKAFVVERPGQRTLITTALPR